MQRYNWTQTFNARDLGYTPTMTGKYIKPLRFIRSDAPHALSDDEKIFLINNDIRTIIDLRSKNIASINPTIFVSDSRFFCYNFPLIEEYKAIHSENDVIENYYGMIENNVAIANIFRTMSNANGGVLFHCQEGKDRTGIISALLLSLVGVSDIDIYADYEISNAYLYDFIKTAKSILPDYLLYVKPYYMENVLRYIRAKYKTTENYLLLNGVSENEIHKLKSKLLE